jgi:[FeFe] hydrogenase H-cluster maturation GTPase HydF
MSGAPRGERLIITLIGKRNVGKSSMINALTGQEIAIVSDTPGTTTDPVAKHYELIPIGPVTFYDTAGLDDIGDLGKLRIKATEKVILRSDLVLFITNESQFNQTEQDIIAKLDNLNIPYIMVFNRFDEHEALLAPNLSTFAVNAKTGFGIHELKEKIIQSVPDYFRQETVIIGDIIGTGDLVVLVVPIDLAAPKGRLILPQVQVIRDILDNDAMALTVKERELDEALERMNTPPALVITDSQVVLKVAGSVPDSVPLTTFSTAFARYKGDLPLLVEGTKAIERLRDGDKVLIAEACSHHIQSDDIGRVKIPRWLRQYTGKELKFDVRAGHDFPENLEKYALVIHCGGCMITGMEFKRRLLQCQRLGIPVTNFGVIISKVQGVLERVVRPFGILIDN